MNGFVKFNQSNVYKKIIKNLVVYNNDWINCIKNIHKLNYVIKKQYFYNYKTCALLLTTSKLYMKK